MVSNLHINYNGLKTSWTQNPISYFTEGYISRCINELLRVGVYIPLVFGTFSMDADYLDKPLSGLHG